MKGFSNKEVVFSSNSNALDTFLLSPVELSENYEAEKGCVHGDKGCNTSFTISSMETIASGYPKFEVSYRSFTGWDSKTALNIQLRVKDFHVQASEITANGLVIPDVRIHSSYAVTITLSGKTYSNVQSIEADTSSKVSGIYKIYLAKNNGLVAYEEYPSRQLWIIQ